jgi:hypothetical protein
MVLSYLLDLQVLTDDETLDISDLLDPGSVLLKISFNASSMAKHLCNISTHKAEWSLFILILKDNLPHMAQI